MTVHTELGPAVRAATVLPLRDTPGGLQVLMLRRDTRITFGGLWVFPGGRVDPPDRAGLPADDELAAARRAAVREADEEAGLALDPGGLVPLSHWTPPPGVQRRFLTWFFLARVESDAVRIDHGEIREHSWCSPAEALRLRDAGEMGVAPPTFVTLLELGRHASVADAMDAAVAAGPAHYETEMRLEGGASVVLWPGDVSYGGAPLDAGGPRHRLDMAAEPWRYERS